MGLVGGRWDGAGERKKQLSFLQIIIVVVIIIIIASTIIGKDSKEAAVSLRGRAAPQATPQPGGSSSHAILESRGASGDATVKPTPRFSWFTPVFLPNHI